MVLYWASGFAAAGLRERSDEARWAQLIAGGQRAGDAAALARPVDGIDFRLQVPKLGYTAIVREGVGLDVLASGPGHYPSTGWPGQPANVGVAAHNVNWIQFSELRPGDDLVLETRYGTFRYRMTGSQIVTPDDTTVLRSQPDRQLTLTTCWPLWAGQFATRRLAVFASSSG
jgi:LPXTG-site transpeptidase (sortase) family protein